MSYESIDQLQKALAQGMFSDRKDAKKTAGRALGTLLELITFYLLKDYGFATNIAIERALAEYANPTIGHNVEFTLHASEKVSSLPMPSDGRMNAKAVDSALELTTRHLVSAAAKAKGNRPVWDGDIKNAATLFDDDGNAQPCIFNAYPDTEDDTVAVYRLDKRPFAMFECKRVGVEEGMKKGPQTIEKAKQGAYVALAASKLQKFRRSDGTQMGILEKEDGSYLIEPYDVMLGKLLTDVNPRDLDGVVLTVGVISDHGNWFTSQHKNKETSILADSYDWLLFLTDQGLAAFIDDALLGGDADMAQTRLAFEERTVRRQGTFTKTTLPADADRELTRYFARNRERIAGWFNIITPEGGTLLQLFDTLHRMASVR